MSDGFIHSVKVPRLYKITAKTVQTVEEEGASLKQKIYQKKHPNLRGHYGLALATIQHRSQLDQLLRSTQLLFKEPRLDPWLARVLMTELLWGKQTLFAESKPTKTILSYEKVLREELKNLDTTDDDVAVNSSKVQKPRYIRINTLVQSVEDSVRSFTDDGWTLLPKCRKYSAFLKALGSLGEGMFLQDFHIPELFAFPPGTHFHDHPGYKCGAIVLQDKASCLPAYLLSATPGSTVLDMCSAPGMKTTHLAAIMKNKGKIIAVEKDNRRYQTLCEIVERNGANCITTVRGDAMEIHPNQNPGIEYILVDPSCSGSGMLDRLSLGKSSSKCAPGRLISLQSFQVLLLRHALLNFPTVKRVVYSTCSMYPEENEMVVDEILENIGDAYDLVPIKKLIGSGWKNFSSTDYKCQDRCLYAKPDVDFSNGFFVAVFERNFAVPLPEYKRKIQVQNTVKKTTKRKRSKSKSASVNGSQIAKKDEESIADETPESNIEEQPVASKKRKLKSVKSEGESVAVETLDEEHSKKQEKKKKRKGAEPQSSNFDEHVEVPNAINGGEPLVEKKKKKKRSQVTILNEDIPIVEISDTEKCKKKKKRPEIEILEDVTSSVEIHNVENKKMKKKKCLADETLEDVTSSVEIHNVEHSKKKKKKRLTDETPEVSSTVEISSEEKSKKKKKRLEIEILEEVSSTTEFSNNEKTKKKKQPVVEILEELSPTAEISNIEKSKKKKKQPTVEMIEEVCPNVEISAVQKIKKNKKQPTVETEEGSPTMEIPAVQKIEKKKKKGNKTAT